MTKEKLMEWGLTEEQANKVMEGLNGSFVTKSRFNEVNEENKTLKAQVSERDGQIETLKNPLVITRNSNQTPPFMEANKQKDKVTPEIQGPKISNAVDVADQCQGQKQHRCKGAVGRILGEGGTGR